MKDMTQRTKYTIITNVLVPGEWDTQEAALNALAAVDRELHSAYLLEHTDGVYTGRYGVDTLLMEITHKEAQ